MFFLKNLKLNYPLLTTLLIVASSAYCKSLFSDTPVNIDADKFEYFGDQANSKVIATGHVIATQDNQIIKAKYVEYNLSKDILLAKDQVKYFESKGYIIDADQIILSDKLKLGSMNNFTILTPDKSILRGTVATKKEAVVDTENAYYTACKLCPGKDPIWDIKAKSFSLDQDDNTATYHHAVLRYYGIPTLYTPYLSHYTSKAERKSGFLKPSYGTSTYLGPTLKIPYYFNLAPNYDATLKLVTTEKRGPLAEGEYRHLFDNGRMNTTASITSAKYYDQPANTKALSPNMRYHIDSKSDFALSNNHYAGWKAKVTSDKSYLRDYRYGNEDFLNSKIYTSSYQKNGFYEVQALSFQNLRPETDSDENNMHQTPMVLPLFDSTHQLHQFQDGSNLSFSSNLLKIHRYAGNDTNRLSVTNKWSKESITQKGHKLNFFGSLRNDFYHYDEAPIANKGGNYTGGVTRTIPEAGIGWSYPLGRNIGGTKIVIEPLTNFIATPTTKYNKNIYNEDSYSSELNDGNLFAHSRYSGLDLIENSSRISYGIKTSAYFKNHIDTEALIGQIYRENPYDYVNNVKEDKFSDYVGRLKINFAEKVIASYQFTVDKYTLVNKTNEANIRLNQGKAYIQTDLLYYKNDKIINDVKNRREINMETGINDYYGVGISVNAKRNLTNQKDNPSMDPSGFISAGTKIKYVNDCITYSASIDKDFTQNDDKKKNTTFWFDVSLKNISE